MDYDAFEVLSFDCYGTLIDWETGIVQAFRLIPAMRDAQVHSDASLLALFARFEAEAEAGEFRPYRSVLEEVAVAVGRELGAEVGPLEATGFADSVPLWRPFEDTVEALRALESRYGLAVVSNVDDDLFAGSARQLRASFVEVVTAEQVRSYKPDPAHFHELIARLGLPEDRLLHVAQSLYHDVAPAGELGIKCVWVNRRGERPGSGATLPSRARPDFEVPDLASLVEAMGL